MLGNQVENLLSDTLKERDDLFLVDLKVSENNTIKVIIDGDNDVTVDDCITVSRGIEHNLDRDEQDFSLEVTSAGATSPLTHHRQYKKNTGRRLKVKTETETFKGQLESVSEDYITLTWKAREPKPVGKGKVTVQKEEQIAFTDIKEAKVMITF